MEILMISFGESLTLFVLSIISAIILGYHAGTWIYKWEQKKKNLISMRFLDKYYYLLDLLNEPTTKELYNEILQVYNDLRCNSDAEERYKNEVNIKFKFKYASYLVNEETEGI
jgi:hypothetical protein